MRKHSKVLTEITAIIALAVSPVVFADSIHGALEKSRDGVAAGSVSISKEKVSIPRTIQDYVDVYRNSVEERKVMHSGTVARKEEPFAGVWQHALGSPVKL